MLLHNIVTVHASGDPNHRLVPDEAIVATLEKANQLLVPSSEHQEHVVRQFIGLLNILDQQPGSTWQEILDKSQFAKPTLPTSDEEALDSARFTQRTMPRMISRRSGFRRAALDECF